MFSAQFAGEKVQVKQPHPHNDVDHPAHYTGGPVEAIDAIEHAISAAPGQVEALLHGNALKYLLRAGRKSDYHTDIAKAHWYLSRLLDRACVAAPARPRETS